MKMNVRRYCLAFAAVFCAVLLFAGHEAFSGDASGAKDRADVIGEENILRNGLRNAEYSGSGQVVAGDLNMWAYIPWRSDNELPKLEAPALLRISDDYPVLDGATAVFPLYAAAVNEVYAADDNEKLAPYMKCSKTEEAYDRLIRGEADVIFVLQPSDEQLNKAKAAGLELRFTPLARDAFVFFVNSRNPVSELSIEQIRNIYRKKFTNWSDLGGNDKKILPFQRPENSGSQTAMIKEVMKGEALPQALHEMVPTMKAVFYQVANYRDYEESIGYSFRFFTEEMMRRVLRRAGYYSQEFEISPEFSEEYQSLMRESHSNMQSKLGELKPVKLLAIDGVAPSVENIRSGAYPFTTDIFAVTAGTPNPHAQELIDWLLSPQGQELIEKGGYVGAAE